ncbi:MAG: hypothetical protein CFE30_33105 [Bradyrhizobium sp. PARBB1]|jgi:uncharacterized protein (DUF1330 family)|nr:MAG: hypothetical protein CFE30_33105 [Bradyrhizobium sp. PARBB1]PSO23694.1 DUF1330 domain-containing protein [Bradyrhizobium sp. MOS004]HAQ79909.1 DUF1330 domain-containing protein [Bradyrhizobium sp.]HAR16596.1 DUF1330 domain-containing protein [Bradyrhizobium sp.]
MTVRAETTVALSMLAGVAIGAVAIEGLHAQSTPKAYVVTEVEVLDQDAQNAYIPKVTEVIKSTGGTYLARGGTTVAFEGEAPKRVTITVYDSLAKAQASRSSAEWKALSAERSKAIKARSYATEGLAN